MPPDILAVVFLAVMGAAVACFWTAFARRKTLALHKKWGIRGAVIDLAGTAVVILCGRVLDWTVPPHMPDVALWHRRLAYVATVLVLLQAISGMRRWSIHHKLWVIFLPVYNVTYLLAVLAYAPR